MVNSWGDIMEERINLIKGQYQEYLQLWYKSFFNNLEWFDSLNDNSIRDGGAKALAEALKENLALQTLRYLNLRNESFRWFKYYCNLVEDESNLKVIYMRS